MDIDFNDYDEYKNIVLGSYGNEILSGGMGNDIISGGYGVDTLSGGEGFDKFIILDDTPTEEFKKQWVLSNPEDQANIEADNIFKSGVAGCTAKHMNYKQYEYINKTVSSEMFYSLMAILH